MTRFGWIDSELKSLRTAIDALDSARRIEAMRADSGH